MEEQEAKVKRVVELCEAEGKRWFTAARCAPDYPRNPYNANHLTPRLKVDGETSARGHPRRNKRAN